MVLVGLSGGLTMKRNFSHKAVGFIFFLALLTLATSLATAQTVLYTFTGYPDDGAGPFGGVVRDSAGNLYGTTYEGGNSSNCYDGCGTVFELVFNFASNTYSENMLYSFTGSGGEGEGPSAGLVMDSSGNLYGTTSEGGGSSVCNLGGCGTVFELVKTGGTYTEKVLHSFTGSGGDGLHPVGALVMDSSGNLYGTTSGGGATGYGTVFELVNSSGTYTEKVVYSFTNGEGPSAGLVMDSSGNLYGTASGGSGCGTGCGTVFELVNTDGTYSEKVIYSFSLQDGVSPQASLIMDSAGNLYGTAYAGGINYCAIPGTSLYESCGTVFELVNSSGTYNAKVLYNFGNDAQLQDGALPAAGLVMDSCGNLYGTTYIGGVYNYGTVFELVNSSRAYTEKVLYSFFLQWMQPSSDGVEPSSLIMDSSGDLYGTTVVGGADGTVFEVMGTPGCGAITVLPTITSLSPSATTAGGEEFTLTINGTNFTSAAVAKWGGTQLPTTYASATQLTAAVPASLIATAGTASVTVTTAGGTSAAATLIINPATQTIIFANPGTKNYGVTPITLTATASSGLPITYTVTSGPATVSGSTLTITGAGSVTVEAAQAGNSSYAAATPVTVSFMVNPATLTVTARNAARLYGASNPAFNFAITGFVNGDTGAVVAGTASLTTAATTSSPVGTYPITFSTKNLTASNYSFTYVSGTLVVYKTSMPLPLWLSQGTATAGGTGFTLTVNGANFTAKSVVLWNGAVRKTTYVSSTRLTVAISAADLGKKATNLVTVANPMPNPGTSAALPFVVMSATPVAAITGGSIAGAADGSGDYVLTLTGNDFVTSSTVEWNSASLTTTYVSPWQISAVITASDYGSLPAKVTVKNPAGTSPSFELP
jgi:uncharacterized repeat protein (TIGR03803 family)